MNKVKLFLFCASLVATLSSYQLVQQEESSPRQEFQEEGFPYPAIPSMITGTEERAAYLLTHFWEKVDFNRHKLTNEDPLMEQGFVDFLSLFPHGSETVLKEAVHNLVRSAVQKGLKAEPVIDLVENYLYHPNSPMLNEEYYRFFLEEFLAVKGVALSEREKLKFHLKVVNKNRVGEPVVNFAFHGKQNKQMNLYDQKAPATLLFFYDAECDECKHVIGQMKKDENLNRLTLHNQLKVVTVCVEGSLEEWNKISDKFPDYWVIGRVDDLSVLYREFIFRAMPTIYLLDERKEVILKDAAWGRVLESIRNI